MLLMLAQAQECKYHLHVLKGRQEVAEHTEDFLPDAGEAAAVSGCYASVMNAMSSHLKTLLPSNWFKFCGAKRQLYGGLAYQHAALEDLMQLTSVSKMSGLQRMRRAVRCFEAATDIEDDIVSQQAKEASLVAARVLDRVSAETLARLGSSDAPTPPSAKHMSVHPRSDFLHEDVSDAFHEMGPVAFFNAVCVLVNRQQHHLQSMPRERFGFAVAGARPVKIAGVQPGSIAEEAGLMAGQYILEVNGTHVRNLSACDIEQIVLDMMQQAQPSLKIVTVKNVDMQNFEELIEETCSDSGADPTKSSVTSSTTPPLPTSWGNGAISGLNGRRFGIE